ncbi:alcohol dehydrogenase catalytic domain-containing protein [Paenibacillus sp. WLX1005]|uniref:alcohol dehydrogenase catalytic domain-containing protein n=1 Tax=Paenibacillus sp. WLX1005 TaxID=3243766 RepID=UPI0039840084
MQKHSLVLYGKKDLKWCQSEIKDLGNDEVLIRTIAGAISIGAELPQYLESDVSDQAPMYPKGTGYENFGEIVSVGQHVESLQVGDRVLASYGHQDYGVIQADRVIPVPADFSPEDALLAILSCDAAKGVLKLNPDPHNKILVTGMGTMGLLTVHFLSQYMGIEQIDVLESNNLRGELALELGAKKLFRTRNECSINHYEFGVECSAANEAFEILQCAVVKEGTICVLSDGNKEPFKLRPEFHEKELKVVASSDGWDYQKHAKWYFDNLRKYTVPLSEIFELTVKSQDLIQCFADLAEGTIHPLKVLVLYDTKA